MRTLVLKKHGGVVDGVGAEDGVGDVPDGGGDAVGGAGGAGKDE